MPHLSPMSWIYFMVMLWLIMMIVITNLWWFLMKPSNNFNNYNLKNKFINWKW
nr:ATP synthase F0 subunit 8 [Hemiclepsis yangtzenensis]